VRAAFDSHQLAAPSRRQKLGDSVNLLKWMSASGRSRLCAAQQFEYTQAFGNVWKVGTAEERPAQGLAEAPPKADRSLRRSAIGASPASGNAHIPAALPTKLPAQYGYCGAA
jgi:hypothetical protein